MWFVKEDEEGKILCFSDFILPVDWLCQMCTAISSRGLRFKSGTVASDAGYPTGSSISSFSLAGRLRSSLSWGPQLRGVDVTVTRPAFWKANCMVLNYIYIQGSRVGLLYVWFSPLRVMQPTRFHKIWRRWFHCSSVSFSCRLVESHGSVWRWEPGMVPHPSTP